MSADAHFPHTQGPHPLAVRLVAHHSAGDHVLVAGAGRGRSLGVLAAAGLTVETAEAGDALLEGHIGPYQAVLSTHALLHGTPGEIARRCGRIRSRLSADGVLYATFGSVRDARYGEGAAVDGGWAPADGDEAGIVHAYFDASGLKRALAGFMLLAMAEYDVREIVGRWAHAPDAALRPSVHWFVEARRD